MTGATFDNILPLSRIATGKTRHPLLKTTSVGCSPLPNQTVREAKPDPLRCPRLITLNYVEFQIKASQQSFQGGSSLASQPRQLCHIQSPQAAWRSASLPLRFCIAEAMMLETEGLLDKLQLSFLNEVRHCWICEEGKVFKDFAMFSSCLEENMQAHYKSIGTGSYRP